MTIQFPENTRCKFCGFVYASGTDHGCSQGMEFMGFVQGKTIEYVSTVDGWTSVHFTDGSQWQFVRPSEGFVLVEAHRQ